MFTILPNTFNPNLQLIHTVPESFFNENHIRYFDNDGFQLSLLEQKYYEANGIVVADILNTASDSQQWLQCNHTKLHLDHSMVLQRWEFTEYARHQILHHRQRFPQLIKYLNIVPKWGLDFALEYYDNDTAIEVLHIESDYRSYSQAMEAKAFLEKRILETDWLDFTNRVIKNKEQWYGLTGFAQNDWKARFWGISKAETIEKAFA